MAYDWAHTLPRGHDGPEAVMAGLKDPPTIRADGLHGDERTFKPPWIAGDARAGTGAARSAPRERRPQ